MGPPILWLPLGWALVEVLWAVCKVHGVCCAGALSAGLRLLSSQQVRLQAGLMLVRESVVFFSGELLQGSFK